jgi:tRNA (cmo5U34)-methyltransferase
MIRDEVPAYERLQQELTLASGAGARRILELGTGTGETARRLLERHPQATLVGIDVSREMLAAARASLGDARIELRVSRLEDPLPEGPFDLVASALCVHHLEGREKADLFTRVREVLAPDGRFVLGDVVVPVDPDDAITPLTAGYDRPSSVAEQLDWLAQSGFEAQLLWSERDLAVVLARPI